MREPSRREMPAGQRDPADGPAFTLVPTAMPPTAQCLRGRRFSLPADVWPTEMVATTDGRTEVTLRCDRWQGTGTLVLDGADFDRQALRWLRSREPGDPT